MILDFVFKGKLFHSLKSTKLTVMATVLRHLDTNLERNLLPTFGNGIKANGIPQIRKECHRRGLVLLECETMTGADQPAEDVIPALSCQDKTYSNIGL